MSQKEDQSTVKDYLTILNKYREIYGQKTALFYQVGSFMEMYALQSPTTGAFFENTELETVAQLCNLALVEKKQTVDFGGAVGRVFMSGNREYFCEKYMQILSDAGYTTVIYTQHKEGAKFVRRLECIVSSGTHITYDTDTSSQHSNYIMCIWIERVNVLRDPKPQYLIGLSTTNIFTGKTYFFEYSVSAAAATLNPTQFDELERQISTFAPSEIIIVSNMSRADLQTIVRFSNIKCSQIHYIDLEENEKAQNSAKQKYIKHVFSTYFGDGDIIHTCAEFQTNVIATQSFCFLLDFIYEHNPNLLKNISLPSLQNTSNRMLLGNQTLRQLNIIEDTGNHDSRRAGKFSSVMNFLNVTCTPMGRRLFQQQFVSPVFDEAWLEREYEMTDFMLCAERNHLVEFFRGELATKFKDLEKLNRQITIRKIFASSLYQLYVTMCSVCALYENIETLCFVPAGSGARERLLNYALSGGSATPDGAPATFKSSATSVVNMFNETMFMEKCKTVSSMTTFEENIFRPGVCPALDEAEKNFTEATAEFAQIHKLLCVIVETGSLSAAATTATAIDESLVKIHETDKHGLSLQITKRRATILKNAIASAVGSDIPPGLADIKIVAAAGGGAAEEITSPHIRETARNIGLYKERLNTLIAAQYSAFLENLEKKHYHDIDAAASFVAKIDVLFSKAYVAQKYHYCRPRIDGTAENSFVEATGMRHVLIEHINQNEVYIPNDVDIGSAATAAIPEGGGGGDGLLVYGVNTTGKTSYIRSVGISVIMAQAGLYVPATSFTYKPYRAIFSRILGNDNLFHGLSTFAVEMSELRVILRMADNHTLVIGDEVCSGTENQSALSIFVAALMELDARQCSYIFATHFHEILEYDEIHALRHRLKIKHMSVVYDREKDVLVYERKLRDGPGHRMYGIEICKSLHMPEDFIEKAYALRNKYYAETAGALSHKPSVYNAGKIRGLCEMCGVRMSEETHHVAQQKDACAETGYITPAATGATFHKNHAGNLMVLCEKCHAGVHSSASAVAADTATTEGGGAGIVRHTDKECVPQKKRSPRKKDTLPAGTDAPTIKSKKITCFFGSK